MTCPTRVLKRLPLAMVSRWIRTAQLHDKRFFTLCCCLLLLFAARSSNDLLTIVFGLLTYRHVLHLKRQKIVLPIVFLVGHKHLLDLLSQVRRSGRTAVQSLIQLLTAALGLCSLWSLLFLGHQVVHFLNQGLSSGVRTRSSSSGCSARIFFLYWLIKATVAAKLAVSSVAPSFTHHGCQFTLSFLFATTYASLTAATAGMACRVRAFVISLLCSLLFEFVTKE